MTTHAHHSTAERLGHRLGRLWRAYGHWERRTTAELAAHWGWSGAVVRAAFWVVKAVAVLVLAYAAFWLLLAAVVMAVVLAASKHSGDDEAPVVVFEDPAEKPGYDPWLYGDAAHPDYPHELDR